MNDTQGHKAGDEYLRQACRMICRHFDHSPVYRVGGDEFAVLLTGTDFEERAEILRRIHEESAANIRTGGSVVSAGISVFDAGSDTKMQAVFERADAEMYREKKLLKSLGAAARI
ncbi:MAG: GGDEF domain-containing protein [Mogibacterium sp.]|nr:GGDEF domain-containing protein [Mogibacterium sp.]